MSVEVTSVDVGLSLIIDEQAVGVTVSDRPVAEVSLTETSVYLNPDVVEVVVAQAEVQVDLNSSPVEVIVSQDVLVVEIGSGLRGRDGTSATGLFIQDVTASGGIVGEKTYETTVPVNTVLVSAVTDAGSVRVFIGCDGSASEYSPAVAVNGVAVVLSESATKRWFTGYADLPLVVGVNQITAIADNGAQHSIVVTRASAGPSVLSLSFGAYPGTQTELKSGDVISFSVSTAIDAVSVVVYGQSFLVSAGAASGVLTVGGQTGDYYVTAVARNAFGTDGPTFVAGVPLVLNQTYPSIAAFSVTYPQGQGAFGAGGVGVLSNTVTNFDTILYSSSNFVIPNPTAYNSAKGLTNTATGYIASGTNLTISATREANNATTSVSVLGKIATVAPQAAITILGGHTRLISSPTGLTYTVQITPNQETAAPPSVNASIGAWTGSWSQVGSTWQRGLIIADSDARGVGVFSALSVTGLSGLIGSTLTSGANYNVGGLSQRTLTFPAFSRVAPLGCAVVTAVKTSAQIVGGNVLSLHYDNGVYQNGYYIADANASYNPTGAYLGLSDAAFAGANTTGTLQVTFSEVE